MSDKVCEYTVWHGRTGEGAMKYMRCWTKLWCEQEQEGRIMLMSLSRSMSKATTLVSKRFVGTLRTGDKKVRETDQGTLVGQLIQERST